MSNNLVTTLFSSEINNCSNFIINCVSSKWFSGIYVSEKYKNAEVEELMNNQICDCLKITIYD